MRLCTSHMAHRGSTGIALLVHNHGTRRSEGSGSRPGCSLPPGKTRYPLYRRLGGHQGQSGQVQKISPPTRIRSLDRPAHSQSLYWLCYLAHKIRGSWCKICFIFKFYDGAESVFTDLWILKDKKPFCLLIQVGRFQVCETTMYSERLENLWKWNLWKGEQTQYQIINLQDKRKTMDKPKRQFGGQNICHIA